MTSLTCQARKGITERARFLRQAMQYPPYLFLSSQMKDLQLKKKCCEKFCKKGKACKRCPIVAPLSKSKKKKFLRQYAELRA